MSSQGSDVLRRLFAGLCVALLGFGLLSGAEGSQPDTTLEYAGWSQVMADGDLWVSFTAEGGDPVGTMTASIAGTSVTLDPGEPAYPRHYSGMLRAPFPVGDQTVTGELVTPSGTKVTRTATVSVEPPLRFVKQGDGRLDPSSAMAWAVGPLRKKVLREGGAVRLAGGAVADSSDTGEILFPITDHAKDKGRVQAGGTAQFTSSRRSVTISDLRWIGGSGRGGSVVADVTYRHRSKKARTRRAVALAAAPVTQDVGDPDGYRSSVVARATAAGARVLGLKKGARLGRVEWRVVYAPKPLGASAKVTLSPRSRPYGRRSTVTAAVTRWGVQASGKVTFKVGSRKIGAARLSGGKASVNVPARLAIGKHKISASYEADYSPTTAATRATVRVNKVRTRTSARLANRTVKRTRRARVRIRVATRGTPVHAVGKVTVFDGKRQVKRVALRAGKRGKVVVRLPRLKKRGKHRLRIVFTGTKAFTGSKDRVVLRVR